jgi:hypothetical protein
MEVMQESANRVRTPVMMWTGSRHLSVEHELPVEEPLEIFVDSQPPQLTSELRNGAEGCASARGDTGRCLGTDRTRCSTGSSNECYSDRISEGR